MAGVVGSKEPALFVHPSVPQPAVVLSVALDTAAKTLLRGSVHPHGIGEFANALTPRARDALDKNYWTPRHRDPFAEGAAEFIAVPIPLLIAGRFTPQERVENLALEPWPPPAKLFHETKSSI